MVWWSVGQLEKTLGSYYANFVNHYIVQKEWTIVVLEESIQQQQQQQIKKMLQQKKKEVQWKCVE